MQTKERWQEVGCGYKSPYFGDKIYSEKLDHDLRAIFNLRHFKDGSPWLSYCWIVYHTGVSVKEAARVFDRENSLDNYDGIESIESDIQYYYDHRNGNKCSSKTHRNNNSNSKDKDYTKAELLDFFFNTFNPLQIDFRIPDKPYEGSITYFDHGFNPIAVGKNKTPVRQTRYGYIDFAKYPLNPRQTDPGLWKNGVALFGNGIQVYMDVDKLSNKHPEGLTQAEIDSVITRARGYHKEQSINGGLHIWAYGDLSKFDHRSAITATDGEITIKGLGSYIVVYPSPGYQII